MLFNSIHFLIFFPTVVILYHLLAASYRSILLLIASYYFYMAWKPEFAILMLISTIIDFHCAIKIDEAETKARKKIYLILSLVANLGMLFYFKYFTFVLSNLNSLLDPSQQFDVMNIILPVGISFYTFQTLSYTIDVYRGDQPSEKNIVNFALFVSFFPQLVAGPIERSTHLINQLKDLRLPEKTHFIEGAKLIAWGFFKKLVIADRLAIYVNSIYNNVDNSGSLSLIIATYLFSFQIFCDFSGYTDIARGTAKFFHVDLMENFKRPYLSKSIGEFWSRWHISLSTWFRDYVYIPLGGNRVGQTRWFINIATVFLLSGIWHGANWTFIAWGALHASYFLIEKLISKTFIGKIKENGLTNIIRIIFTYHLVVFAWIFFRANTIGDAKTIISKIFLDFSLSMSSISSAILPFTTDNRSIAHFLMAVSLVVFLEFIHILQEKKSPLLLVKSKNVVYFSFISLIISTIFLGKFNENSFIYFQF